MPFGSRRDQDGASPTVDATNWVGGLISGVDGRIDATTRAGGFLGGSTGAVDVAYDSQTIDVDSFYGGVYGGTQSGPLDISLALSGGHTWNDSERRVANNLAPNGLQTAKADYDGWFVSPEAKVALETGMGFVPSAYVRYAGYFLDGYTETGAAGNLTVRSRDLHILQGRLQVALPLVTTTTYISPYAGIEGRTLLSGNTVDAVLLGQNLSFDPGGDSQIGSVFIGLNAAARLASAVDVYGNVESAWDTDNASRVSGNVGLRLHF